jgi:hypothetical protein
VRRPIKHKLILYFLFFFGGQDEISNTLKDKYKKLKASYKRSNLADTMLVGTKKALTNGARPDPKVSWRIGLERGQWATEVGGTTCEIVNNRSRSDGAFVELLEAGPVAASKGVLTHAAGKVALVLVGRRSLDETYLRINAEEILDLAVFIK